MASHQARIFSFCSILVFCLFAGACTHKVEIDNSLQIEMRANIKGLDPINANDWYAASVISVVYESLYQYKYLKRPLEVEPLLAESMPEVSKDGLKYTIKLKKGVRFSDSDVFPGGKGREVTSKDFVYSWKRLADPANESEGFWVFDGKIKGLNDWRSKKTKGEVTYDTPVEGLQTPDDHTIVISLVKPYYQLLYQLTSPYTAVVAREAVEKYGREFLNHAVGTGPYVFSDWVRNSHLVFVRNPNWRGENYPNEGNPEDAAAGLLADKGKPMPFADKVVFHELIEDQPRWLKFMKGGTDYVEVPKDNFDTAIKDHRVKPEFQAKGIQLREDPDPAINFTGFNMMDPILGKSKLLRQAMVLALDAETELQKFYNGEGLLAQSLIPPGIDGYDPNFKNPYAQHSVEKAKQLLAKAGYPDGKGLPDFDLAIPDGAQERQLAEYLQQQEAQIGIHLNISMSSWPQFDEKMKDKKVQLFSLQWVADYPDAEDFLQLFYGPNESPGPNSFNYHNKEFDKMYDQAAKIPPSPARTAIYQKMRDIIVEDEPAIIDLHRFHVQLYHGWIKNFKPHYVILNTYKYLRVDLDKEKELKAKL